MDVTHQPTPPDLHDHLAVLRRNWWLVVVCTALGLTAAAAITTQLPRSYESVTSVLVLPAGDQDANAEGGRTKNTINLDTEAQLVRSTAVAARARALLHTGTPPSRLSEAVSVSVPPNSTVLNITFTAPTPRAARNGSHAFATAYLANRVDGARAAAETATKALHEQVDKVTGQLEELSAKLAGTTDASTKIVLQTKRRNLSQQLDDLTTRLGEATAEPVDGGRIISAASLPTAPTSPVLVVDLAAGAMLGLLLGILAALLRARVDRRIRCADDVRRRTGTPVLAELTRTPDQLLAPTTEDGRVFSRLRNELTARDTRRPLVAVVGTRTSPVTTAVAANLAAAFSRAGNDTILVTADMAARSSHTAVALLGVSASPGWSDVLSGGTPLDEALQAAAREPCLRVLPVGAAASAAGLCQSESARNTLTSLRARADHVIIAAPDTRSGADAQTLASLADAAILAVERRSTRTDDILDAVDQLRRVGTPLLGAVLVPAMTASPEEAVNPQADEDPLADFPADGTEADTRRGPADSAGDDAGRVGDRPDRPIGEAAPAAEERPVGDPTEPTTADQGEPAEPAEATGAGVAGAAPPDTGDGEAAAVAAKPSPRRRQRAAASQGSRAGDTGTGDPDTPTVILPRVAAEADDAGTGQPRKDASTSRTGRSKARGRTAAAGKTRRPDRSRRTDTERHDAVTTDAVPHDSESHDGETSGVGAEPVSSTSAGS